MVKLELEFAVSDFVEIIKIDTSEKNPRTRMRATIKLAVQITNWFNVTL